MLSSCLPKILSEHSDDFHVGLLSFLAIKDFSRAVDHHFEQPLYQLFFIGDIVGIMLFMGFSISDIEMYLDFG